MTDATIGRLLVAPLHQAILDALPGRVDFYEYWLTNDGLRGGTIGRAPMMAVLGFLRSEGDVYARVMDEAGELAGEWGVDALPAWYRRFVLLLPVSLRLRACVRIVKRVNAMAYSAMHTTASVRRGVARLEMRDGIFCQARHTQSHPLCGYHAALAGRVLARFNLPATVTIDSCIATGAAACVCTITIGATGTPA